MNLFKKKQRKAYKPNTLAVKAISRLDLVQTRTAEWLNSRTVSFTKRQQIGFLVITCLLLGGSSLYLLIRAFS